MAESPNGQLISERVAGHALKTVADATAAIRETRARLDMRLVQATQQLDGLLNVPYTQRPGSNEPGLLALTINGIAAIRARTRAWHRAWQTGLLRKATMGGAAIGVAVAVAVRTKRRISNRTRTDDLGKVAADD